MDAAISFTVNGQKRTVTTDPRRPLLDVLREDLHLTGTKYGCGEARCGACTVLVDETCVPSCSTPVSQFADKSIVTIEGLADGEVLHPVQEAFLAEGAFQCGFCTPGMILATVALLKEAPDPTDEQILTALDTHLCRCCGYTKILKAVRRAAAQAGRSQS
jgi:aerobic-type carbon monoxide dehydrogenase small subunit (CoxS/CutS family)